MFLNSKNQISGFFDSEYIRVFEKKNEKWEILSDIVLESEKIKSIASVREYYKFVGGSKINCEIIVTNKAVGIPYNVFECLGFSIWELKGEAEEHLDNILYNEKMVQVKFESKKEENYYREINEGIYEINLIKIQGEKPEISSKMIIRPVLKNKNFKELNIECCHIPPWILKELKDDMRIITEQNERNMINLKIKKL